jgi:hypothetical protein
MKKRIELLKQHIHAGLPHKPGAVIELDADLADWLIHEGAAKETTPNDLPARNLSIPKGKTE